MAKKIDPLVIVPNFKIRLSGVTSTIIALLPIQSKLISVKATGPGLPKDLPYIPLIKLIFLSRRILRVWHARRNTEMLAGILLKILFRCNLKLMFTSASQRKHTFFTKLLLRQMDHVVATSLVGQTYLEVPSTVIMHGVDTNYFSPCKRKEILRKDLGLPNNILIGCIGRIRPSKGTDIFLDAAVKVLKSNKKITFLIIGRTTQKFINYKNRLIKKVNDLGLEKNILFLEEVSWREIAKYYRSLDLFVAPQRHEGFGLTPSEAMASGVPVLAFKDVGAFNEQIINKKTGFIIENKCSHDLAGAIEKLTTNPQRVSFFSKNAREHVLKNFNIENEANELVKVYRKLLKA